MDGVNTIGVQFLNQALAAVTKNGGKVPAPKMTILGVGWFAMIADPDGNRFGLMESDESAK